MTAATASSSPGRHRSPANLRRLLGLLVAAALVLLVGGLSAVIVHLRTEALARTEHDTQGVARLLEDNIARTLAATNATLLQAARIAADRQMGNIRPSDELVALQNLVANTPERGDMIAVDPRGKVSSSTAAPSSGVGFDISDRPWFQAIANGQPMVVGPMFRTRLANQLVFTVSRRVEGEGNRFLGMVSSGINVDMFADYHQSLVLGRNGFIAAYANGALILRQPNPQAYVGNVRAGTNVLAAAAVEPFGTFRAVSGVDGIERIVSYRTIPGYNVVVAAAAPIDEALAPWYRTALFLLCAMAVVISGVLGLGVMAFRAVAREEEAAEGLEATVRERTLEAESRAEEARLANQSKTRFLAAASHDLRQPLQAAGMFAEVLMTRIEGDARLEPVVDKLRQSIEATNALLTSLLDVSTLEAGKIQPNVGLVRLMPLLTRLVEQLEPEASAKGLSIGALPTSFSVESDPILLERMLRNLLVNAVRYTETGGIRVGCRRRGPRVAIQVWDSGPGIPPDKVQAVFDDFVRLDTPGEHKGSKGLGLGLGVVRRMAGLLGHQLELRSWPGRGSCFGVVVKRA